jgi:hypothetical protein
MALVVEEVIIFKNKMSSGEPNYKVGKALEKRATGASIDLTKRSPSNGQCPT